MGKFRILYFMSPVLFPLLLNGKSIINYENRLEKDRPTVSNQPSVGIGVPEDDHPMLLGIENADSPQFRPQGRKFALVNRTGETIYYILLRPAGMPNWGDDLLGERTLASGMQANIYVGDDCIRDIRGVATPRLIFTLYNQDVCTSGYAILTPQNRG